MSTNRDSIRDKIRARNKQNLEKKNGAGIFQLPEGMSLFKPLATSYNIDVLEYKVTVPTNPVFAVGEYADSREVFIHNNLGEEGNKKSIICPRTIRERCPICEQRNKLFKRYEENKDLIYALKPQRVVLYNIFIAEENKQYVFKVSYKNFTELLEKEMADDEEGKAFDYAFLEGGKTLKIRFEKKMFGKNEYFPADKISFKPRKSFTNFPGLSKIVNLDTCFTVLPYDTIKEMILEDEPIVPTYSDENDDDADIPMTDFKKTCPKGFNIIVDFQKHDECNDCPQATWNVCANQKD